MLFTYLIVSRALPARREALIAALWPWRAPAGADAPLSALLAASLLAGGDVLRGRSQLRLHLPLDAWIDPRGRRGRDPPRGGVCRASGLAARVGTVARRAVHRSSRFSARRGSPLGPGAPRAPRGDPHCRARVLRGRGPRRGRLRARPRSAQRARAGSAHALPRARLRTADAAAREARGNAAEALRVYEQLRQRLRDELGARHRPSCARCRKNCSAGDAPSARPALTEAASHASLTAGRDSGQDDSERTR